MKNFVKSSLFLLPLFIVLFTSSYSFGQIDDVELSFSSERGFKNAPFSLNFSANDNLASIIYTSDGSKPTLSNGTLYDQSLSTGILINSNTVIKAFAFNSLDSTRVHSHTYLFVSDIVGQQGVPSNYPATWGTGPGDLANQTIITQNGDYDMDTAVVNDAQYSAIMEDALKKIPSLSISMHIDSLFSSTEGIYSNPLERGDFWQKEGAFEFFNSSDSLDFSINCGIQLNGASTRYLNFYKHSFKFEFKKEYGKGKLKKAIFGEDEVDVFDCLVLRMVGHCTPHDWNPSRRNRTIYEKDQFIRELQQEMGHLSSNGRFVHVYLNGLYWGLYNLVERPDEHFMSERFGGSDEDYDVCNSLEFNNGDSIAYYEMMDIVDEGVSNTSEFENLEEYLDMENFADYLILNHWGANTDWDEHNWWATKDRRPGGKFNFFAWDSEFALYKPKTYQSQVMSRNFYPNPTSIHTALKNYLEYKYIFADRIQCNCIEEDGPLHKNQYIPHLQSLYDNLDIAVIPELARWGDVRSSPSVDYFTQVEVAKNELRDDFLDERVKELVYGEGLVNGYYTHSNQILYTDLIPSVKLSKLGGVVNVGEVIDLSFVGTLISYLNYEIYYTLDGSDPRNSVNSILLNNINDGIAINSNSMLRVRVKEPLSGFWGASCPRTFYIDQNYEDLVINEIHFDPADEIILLPDSIIDGREYSYIELHNKGTEDIDLSGVYFSSGFTYEFPFGTVLNQGGFITLAENSDYFNERFGVVAFAQFKGKLENGGENVVIKSPAENIIDSVRYDDISPWPLNIDTLNVSISLINPNFDNSQGENWSASNMGLSPNDHNMVCDAINIQIMPMVQPCENGDNGEIIANALGVNGPYTYTWTNGASGANITNLTSGSYTVFVEDANGCGSNVSLFLEPLNAPIITSEIIGDSGITDGAININITSGFSLQYSFWWKNANGSIITTSQNLTNMNAGQYSLDIIDANNCVYPFEFEISTTFIPDCSNITGLNASSISTVSAFINWSSSADAVNGYTVQYKTVVGNNWQYVNVNNSFSFLTNLLPCVEYEFAVVANCVNGVVGNLSDFYYFTTDGCQNSCLPLEGLNSFNVNNQSGILSWDLYPNATYTLHYRNLNDGIWYDSPMGFPLAILFGLEPCSQYEWYVELQCDADNNSLSAIESFNTTGCDGGDSGGGSIYFGGNSNNNSNKLNEFENDLHSFSIYPNPSTGLVGFMFNKPISGIYNLDIYDLSGKIVFSENLELFETNIINSDVSRLTAGNYLIKISNDVETIKNKLIILEH